jgi:integrase
LLLVADLYEHFKKILESYKATGKHKTGAKDVPSDKKIKEVYYNEFKPTGKKETKSWIKREKWQWLYGLLATYGLRIHEAWNIANWDKPVISKGGQWVDTENDEMQWIEGNDIVIPAFNDPTNTDHVLAIKHTTKTGYRQAYPLSPKGENWVTEFNLLGAMKLPELKNPLKRGGKNQEGGYRCSNETCFKFKNKNLGFTPHCLRHAFNHRGRLLGISTAALAVNLGHGEETNSTTYAKHMAVATKKALLENELSNKAHKTRNNNYSLAELKKQAASFAGEDIGKLNIINQFLNSLEC